MSLDSILRVATGPYGALALALIAVVYLWRKLEQSQAALARQQDLFEEALKVIRDDLLPLVQEAQRRRFWPR